MIELASYVCGKWVAGKGGAATLVNPATEEPLATASTQGLDFGAALSHARDHGGPALRAMTFAKRGELLRAMSRAIHAKRDELISLAIANGGNTRSDAKFDIDGATGTLAAYADLAQELGDTSVLVDGDGIQLGRSPRLFGQHLYNLADPFFRHKTTNREMYDRLHKAARAAGFDEVIFMNDRDEVTEGAVSNIFIEQSGRWLTPPLASGVLPGVYRRHMLKTRPAAEECVLSIADLQSADAVYVCNALRGLRKVTALVC